MKKLTKSTAVQAINKYGILLVYPVAGKEDPLSLWSVAYPRSKMRWEWDEDGDDRVATLWHLREQLSRSRQVVYAKWFQGRATFFSLEVFFALLALQLHHRGWKEKLSRDAKEILAILEEESTQSTKQLKRACGLVGRNLESTYARAMKELWSRNLIVAYGEVDEGAFPSLAVGATRLIFEDLYNEAQSMSREEALKIIAPVISASPALTRFYLRQEKGQGIQPSF
ncbi:MAG: AlkZ-related protein [Bdellovibrionota bacterium]